jgi:hypothetical protein
MQEGAMRNQHSHLIAFAFLVALWIPGPASAAEFENAIALREVPTKAKFSITPVLGTDFTVGGDWVESATETFAVNGTIGGSAVAGGLSISAPSQDFDDVYDRPVSIGVNVNYGLSSSAEVFGGIHSTFARSDEFDAINIDAAGTIDGTAVALNTVVTGEFDDYHELGIDGGYRHFFRPGKRLRPYISGSVGLKHVDYIELDLIHKSTDTKIDDIKFYDTSTTYTLGLGLGFRYDASPNIAIGMETGLKYAGDLDEDDGDISGARSFADTNNSGDKLDIPLMARINIAF